MERIELGKYEMETWYFSPLPAEFNGVKVRNAGSDSQSRERHPRFIYPAKSYTRQSRPVPAEFGGVEARVPANPASSNPSGWHCHRGLLSPFRHNCS